MGDCALARTWGLFAVEEAGLSLGSGCSGLGGIVGEGKCQEDGLDV